MCQACDQMAADAMRRAVASVDPLDQRMLEKAHFAPRVVELHSDWNGGKVMKVARDSVTRIEAAVDIAKMSRADRQHLRQLLRDHLELLERANG